MDIKKYQELALRTDPSPEQYAASAERLSKIIRLDHAVRGMTTEVGEAQDNLKRHIFYGKELDLTNLIEEGGDFSWYMALFFDEVQKRTGVDILEVLSRNIAKLQSRYPEKFTEESALNRNLEEEQKALQGELNFEEHDEKRWSCKCENYKLKRNAETLEICPQCQEINPFMKIKVSENGFNYEIPLKDKESWDRAVESLRNLGGEALDEAGMLFDNSWNKFRV